MLYWLKGDADNSGPSLEARRKGRLFYGWIVIAASLLILTIAMSTRYSFGVFFKALEEDFGLTRAMTSGIFSLQMVLSPAASVLGGWALDRYGPRIVALLSGFFVGLSLLLASQASSLWHLYISYSFLLALGIGAIYSMLMATASRWFIRKRGIAVGIVGCGSGLAVLVSAPIATYLISVYGWRTSYIVMALTAWIVIMVTALLLRKDPGEIGLLPDGETLNRVEMAARGQQSDAGPRELSLPEAVKTRSFWLVWLIWLLFSFTFHLVLTHLVRHALDLEVPPMRAAAMLSLMGGISILGRLIAGRASDRIGKRPVAVAFGLLQAGAMLWLTGSTSIWMLYLFVVAYGLFHGGFDPPILAVVGEIFGLRNVGVIMGTLSAGWAIGAAIGPTLAGHIFDISGSYSAAFLTGAIAMLIAALFALLLQAPKAAREKR